MGLMTGNRHQHHVYDVTMKNYPVSLLNFTIQESKKHMHNFADQQNVSVYNFYSESVTLSAR
jgi:hypothetical protein